MGVRWTPQAFSNLESITLYIAADNPEIAAEVSAEIFERVEQLVVFPNRGRPGREPGTRELVLSPLPYIAVYRLRQDAIEILSVWHGAQDH